MMRRPPRRARGVPLSALGKSIVADCCRCSQTATNMSENCNRVVDAAISASMSAAWFPCATHRASNRPLHGRGGVSEQNGMKVRQGISRRSTALHGTNVSAPRRALRPKVIPQVVRPPSSAAKRSPLWGRPPAANYRPRAARPSTVPVRPKRDVPARPKQSFVTLLWKSFASGKRRRASGAQGECARPSSVRVRVLERPVPATWRSGPASYR